jgi:hypothetical protein
VGLATHAPGRRRRTFPSPFAKLLQEGISKGLIREGLLPGDQFSIDDRIRVQSAAFWIVAAANARASSL